jgi:hypothetical protein
VLVKGFLVKRAEISLKIHYKLKYKILLLNTDTID